MQTFRFLGAEPRDFPGLGVHADPGEVGFEFEENPDPQWFEPVDMTDNSVSVPTPAPTPTAAEPAPEGA